MNILAIDQGTSATKALVVAPGNEVLGSAEVPVRPRGLAGGGVEQDPEELWQSVLAAGRGAVASARAPVHAVALANQGETVLAWDRRSGRPLTPAIVWQDRRSAPVCERLSGSATQRLSAEHRDTNRIPLEGSPSGRVQYRLEACARRAAMA